MSQPTEDLKVDKWLKENYSMYVLYSRLINCAIRLEQNERVD